MGNCGSGKDYSKKTERKTPYTQNVNEKQQGQMAGGPAKGPQPGSNMSFNPVMYDHVIANQGNVEKEYKL
jgi:hypothetical protein